MKTSVGGGALPDGNCRQGNGNALYEAIFNVFKRHALIAVFILIFKKTLVAFPPSWGRFPSLLSCPCLLANRGQLSCCSPWASTVLKSTYFNITCRTREDRQSMADTTWILRYFSLRVPSLRNNSNINTLLPIMTSISSTKARNETVFPPQYAYGQHYPNGLQEWRQYSVTDDPARMDSKQYPITH